MDEDVQECEGVGGVTFAASGDSFVNAKDEKFMRLAIKIAARSRSGRKGAHPLVGAVVAKDGKLLAKAYRGQRKLGEHAEFTALDKLLQGRNIAGATVYTTLEPCTTRNHPKVPCVDRLINRDVGRVVIGMLDPNQNICGRGVLRLRENGIAVELFPKGLMHIVERQNYHFAKEQRANEARLIASDLGQRGSAFDFTKFADDQTRELIFAVQNMRGLLARPDFLPRIRRLLRRDARITFILTTLEAMKLAGPEAVDHFRQSVLALKTFWFSISSQAQRRRLRIRFHRGPATLSAQVRDPDLEARAQIVFTPKWATDIDSENRIYCVLERRKHRRLFEKLYGPLPGMAAGSCDLKKMCSTLSIEWRR